MITAKNPIAGRCCALVVPRDSGLRFPELHRNQCSHKVAVIRTVKGKGELGFCKIHAPEAQARRDAEKSAKWKADSDAQRAAWNRNRAERDACNGMTDPVVEVAALKLKAAERDAWKLCAELAMTAMGGSVKRLRIALAEAAGDPEPQFHQSAPLALDNIHAVAAATAAYEKLKGQS